MPVKHAFTSPKSDGADATRVRPSDWNAAHIIGGYDIERRTAGNIAVTSTTTGAAFPTIGTLTVAADAGDLLEIGLSTRCNDTNAVSARFDVGTIVSSSVVNYLSSLSGTANALGIPAWFCGGSSAATLGGSLLYVVQSGDISGGNVELGLRAWLSSAGTRTFVASTSEGPLDFWVKNLQQ